MSLTLDRAVALAGKPTLADIKKIDAQALDFTSVHDLRLRCPSAAEGVFFLNLIKQNSALEALTHLDLSDNKLAEISGLGWFGQCLLPPVHPCSLPGPQGTQNR